MKLKSFVCILLALLMLACLTACGATAEDVISVLDDVADILLDDSAAPDSDITPDPFAEDPFDEPDDTEDPGIILPEADGDPSLEEEEAKSSLPDRDGWYYDLTSVVLYIDTYGTLPSNFITKKDAEKLGWSGGSIQQFVDGAAIGGTYFGNYEGLLPSASGRSWTECDIDTDGVYSRGAKRLIFSNDGLYFYTDDHYKTFREVLCENGEVIVK